MKTILPSFVFAAGMLLLFPSCASSDPLSSGQPVAAQREEARRYGTPTRLSADPDSMLHDIETNKGQVSTKIAEF